MQAFASVDADANTTSALVSAFSEFQPGIPAPANLTKMSGDNQFAAPNSNLTAAFVAKLTDNQGSPIGGWPVKFERTAGSGKFDPPEEGNLVNRAATVRERPDSGLTTADGHFIDATGKEFRVTTPSGRTITLQSSEEVHVFLEASDKMISYIIDFPLSRGDQGGCLPAPIATTIILAGLEPSLTWCKFEDSYRNETVVNIGADTTYSYTQDISKRHHVFYQPGKGTIFVDENGPSQPVGNWDVATKTLTLTQDVHESIEITADGITLDGAAHVIRGLGYGYGIYCSGRSSVVVRNCIASQFAYGICLYNSSNNTLTNNTASSNYWFGINLFSSSNNNLTYNNASGPGQQYGIFLNTSSDSNTLTSNTINSNTYYGIRISFSSYNTLTSNIANSNSYGILICLSHCNTLTSNTANNNQAGIIIDSSLLSTLTSNTANSNTNYGIYLYAGSKHNLTSNIANSNRYGIYLFYSSNNTVTRNTITGSSQGGLVLDASPAISVWHNNIYGNGWFNVYMYSGTPIELSRNGEGNFWGHTEPPGFYVYGGPNTPYDSNRADVVDSFPYL